MKKLYFILIIVITIFVMTSFCFSQNCFSVVAGNAAYESQIIQTSDGGYAVAGTYWGTNFGGMVTKIDSLGNVQWRKRYEAGTGATFKSIAQTLSGGYMVAGFSSGISSITPQYWVLSLDSVGNVQWAKEFGGVANDYAYSVIQTSDSNYVVAGKSNSFTGVAYSYWLLKLDTGGNVLWQKTYGNSVGADGAYQIIQTSDGGYAVTGMGIWNSNSEVWFIKLYSDGNIQWEKSIGGPDYEIAYSLVQTSDGGYVMAGTTLPSGGEYDIIILKTDSNGNLLWNKTFGGSWRDKAYSIIETKDGNYLVAGHLQLTSSTNDYYSWLIKTDTSGNLLWEKVYGTGFGSIAYSVVPSIVGGYAVSNTSWTFALDSAGNGISCPVVSVASNGSLGISELATTATITSTSVTATIATPTVTALSGQSTPCPCNITTTEPIAENPLSLIFPNPSFGKFTIYCPFDNSSVTIFNIFGEKIYQSTIVHQQSIINLSSHPSGLYFLKLSTSEGQVFVDKIILQ